jgi:hypothetical protein
VIARQFFPAEQRFRSGLPQVPACPKCNSAKQRVEDGPGVILQFGHSSDASSKLILGRVLRTLAKNDRLRRSLRQSLRDATLTQPDRLKVPGMVITLSHRELADLWALFRYVARGLYRFELCTVLPADHTIHLVKPASYEHFVVLRDLIARDANRQSREHAAGELRYAFARNDAEQLTMWMLAFKSIEMFWITAGPTSSATVQADLAKIEWTRPAASTSSM